MRHTPDGFRYVAEEMTADIYGRDRIAVRPGPAWGGHLPPSFFGTVTAVMMTWRGGLAMHGSAVELDGKAILLCGASGAGKSTLAAALIASGGHLISDDLSVLFPQAGLQPPLLFAGRRTLRLFSDVADMLAEKVKLEPAPTRDSRKMVVIPPRVDPVKPFPLKGIIVLGEGTGLNSSLSVLELLRRHLYRRRGMRGVPGRQLRTMQLAAVAHMVPVRTHPAVEARDQAAFQRYAEGARREVLKAASDA
jgi:hypothetical protein